MAGVIEELVISLGLDASQLQTGVQNVAQQLGPGLQSAAQAGAASIGELVTQLTEAAQEAESLGETSEFIAGLTEGLTEAAHEAEALGESTEAFSELVSAITEAAHEAEALGDTSTFIEGLSGFLTEAAQEAEGLGEALSGAAQSATQAVEQAQNAGGAVSEVVQNAAQAAGQAAQGASDAVDAVMNTLGDLSQHTAEELQSAIASLQGFYEALRSDASLTDAERAAGMEQTRQAITDLERELGRRLPEAARQGFSGAEAAASRFGGALSSIWAQIAGPLAGIFAIGNSISTYISESVAAGELADKLKVDVEEIQVWNGAMERAGGSASGLQQTIQKLTESGKDNGDVFATLLDLAGQAEKLGRERFEQKAKELELDEDTTEVLLQGRKELEMHLKRQRELGVYTKEDAEQSKKFKQALSDLGTAWNSLTAFIGRFAVPIMKLAADVLTNIVIFLRQHTPFVAAAITLIGTALAVRLLPPLKELPKAIRAVWTAFTRWFPLIAVITALALLFDDFWTYVTGGESELAEFWAIFGTGPEILAALNAAWEETKKVLFVVLDGLKRLLRYFYDVGKASGSFQALGEIFRGLLQILKGLFTLDWGLLHEGLVNLVTGLARGVAATFKILGIIIRDTVVNIWNALREALPGFAQFADGLKEIFSGLLELDASKILSAIGSMLSGVGDMLAAGLKSWLSLCAKAWEAIIEVFTGKKIDLTGMLDSLWDSVTQALTALKDWIWNWFAGLFDFDLPDFGAMLQAAWDKVLNALQALVPGVTQWAGGIAETFKGLFTFDASRILSGIGDLLSGALSVFSNGLHAILNLAANLWESVIAVFTEREIDLSGMLDSIWNAVTGVFTRLKEWIVDWFKNLFAGIELPSIGDILGGAGDLAKGAAGAVGKAVGGVVDLGKSAGSAVKSWFTGETKAPPKAPPAQGPAPEAALPPAKSAAETFNAAMRDALAFDGIFDEVEPEANKAGDSINTVMGETAEAAKGGFNAAWSATADFAVKEFQGAASTINGILSGVVSNVTAQVGALALDAQAMAGNAYMVPAFAGVRAQNAGNSISNNTSSVNIGQMNVSTRATDANGVARGMRGALNKNRLVQAGQSGVNQK